ncbi:MAG: mercury transporter MerT [Acidobacteria bacterium]|nr:mercury transporter MerT [Acidobacteriota bacterium]
MKTALASVLAAGVASACCIGPVAVVLLGAGTFAAALSALEPYRPFLLSATALLLGVAFYVAYRPTLDRDTCSPASRTRNRVAVWFAVALTTALATFPYYVLYLF